MGTGSIMVGFCSMCTVAAVVGALKQLDPSIPYLAPWAILAGSAAITTVQLWRSPSL